MNRCKTCKHWDQHQVQRPPYDRAPDGFRFCFAPRVGLQYCDGQHGHVAQEALELRGDELALSGGDYYGPGHVSTGPDFACLHWEPKD